MRPLARDLARAHRVVLPDQRGYGRSVCTDPRAHTWSRYVADVVTLLAGTGERSAALVGAGLGGTVALRAALEAPGSVDAVAVISPEDVEDDAAKAAETTQMDRFAEVIRSDGLAAAWELYLPHLQPLIGSIVREAIPRSDPASAAAAAAIGRDRSFRDVDELLPVRCPVLLVPGGDARHPSTVAEQMARTIPGGVLSDARFGDHLVTVEDLADEVGPRVRTFLAEHGRGGGQER